MRFGTDGVRGVANVELTPELVLALGRAAAGVLARRGSPFLIGRDTRLSGPMLEGALASGLASAGVDVGLLGVLPTPGVAWRSAADSSPAAMISASHNPYADNGIKFFAAGGRKLTDGLEAELEAELDRILAAPSTATRMSSATGSIATTTADDRYADARVDVLEGRTLDGLHVVIDCANGAGYRTAPDVLRRLGVRIDVLFADPDGTNINDGCGSTHPEDLRKAVVAQGADVGLALDGDADRVLAVDHRGEVVDGDQIIALCALDWRERGRLRDDTVAVTVMANLGFRQAMAGHGIRVVETAVGDRYVLEALEEGGWSMGGEQSGHVIFRELATTGDGLLTGLEVLDVMARTGKPLAELASVMKRFPQVLRNVRVARREGLDEAHGFWAEVEVAEADLDGNGRVLVRASGTEPVVRVMVEAPTADQAEGTADRLCAVLADALGPPTP
ncbi:MAG: phosphoglucosamine mutase [Acidimicrobiia bacterium]|nr:phosphoglucosamine mutase [Acidimicrobiia bacterium]